MNPLRRVLASWHARKAKREQWALLEVKARYHAFRIFLENNGRALELIVDIDSLLSRGEDDELPSLVDELLAVSGELVDGLNLLSGDAHPGLYALHGRMAEALRARLSAVTGVRGHVSACMLLDDLEPAAYRQAGTKAANLATLRRMGLPVPDGFVCTVRACRQFLNNDGLDTEIRRMLRNVEYGRAGLMAVADEIRDKVLTAPLPVDLSRSLLVCHARLMEGKAGGTVSVRSSGVAEDRADHSFAGQYTSVLNVAGGDALLNAFREVVASGFGARAIAYRQRAGMDPAGFDLAVLFQTMVRARAAGVLMTRDPGRPRNERMLLSAVSGLGTMAVDGSAPADLYRPWRSDAERGTMDGATDPEAVIVRKTVRTVADHGGGLREEAVPAQERDRPLLAPELIVQLTRYGEMIENLYGMAQDIEWAVDDDGQLSVLQARPLRVSSGGSAPAGPVQQPLVSGVCASAGKAVGRVLLARSAEELADIMRALPVSEDGSRILVLPQGLVEASRHLPRCAGLIVDAGNPTDHLSCIARECGLPMITGAGAAARDLAADQWVVLDADNGQVLEAAPELWAAVSPPAARVRTATGGASDGRVLDPSREELRHQVAQLNLTDAYGPTFSQSQCRSVHDLVRYTHEMAVLAMFHAGDLVMNEAGGLLRPLDIGVPFHFLVIDVGGGVRREATSPGGMALGLRVRVLGLGDILSRPLAALCEGLTTPGLSWHSAMDGSALSGLLSRSMLDARSTRPVGSFNYALAARDYLNLNSRVEFHFAMLDAVCGGNAQANYIRFRFKGGGTGPERTSRRALFLREVLEENGFITSVKGDLVTASLTGVGREVVRARLVMLGRLIGFSRCLDAAMRDDDTAHRLARGFLSGCYDSQRILEQSEVAARQSAS